MADGPMRKPNIRFQTSMFTDCPECHRQFRIRARQLSAARGMVKCGYCGAQFNALERLQDEPHHEEESGPVQQVITEAIYDPPEDDFDKALRDGLDDTDDELSGLERMERGPDEPFPMEEDDEVDELPGIEQESLSSIEMLLRPPVFAEPEPEAPPSEEELELPEILRERPVAVHHSRYRWLWSAGSALLVLLAITQSAWFNRDLLLNRYPSLTPHVNQMCDRLQCQVIRRREVAAIKLVNRDVREHPRYRNALLVNATIANRFNKVQPYPRIQLALFDTDGRFIAQRIFDPREYLDNSIDLGMGMTPNIPVHFVLEVIAPPISVESFEFRFL